MVHATVTFLPEYLQSISEIENFDEAIKWFVELPLSWQLVLGFGTIGIAISAFLLLIASWFKA